MDMNLQSLLEIAPKAMRSTKEMLYCWDPQTKIPNLLCKGPQII